MFCGYDDFSTLRMSVKDGKIVQKGTTGTQTEQQKQISRELKALFPAYLNSLGLKDAAGHPLTLDENGNGSFLEAVKAAVQQSAQRELETHHTARKLSMLAVKGSEVEKQSYLTIKDGRVTALDWDGFRGAILRMKTAPAFDALDMMSPEKRRVWHRKHRTPPLYRLQSGARYRRRFAGRTGADCQNESADLHRQSGYGKALAHPAWSL